MIRRIFGIARLTLAEGIRMRIVLVCLVMLAFLIVLMSSALRGDETLSGRLQNFLAYSLAALSALLSVATIFFSCATLSKEITERSLHLVVTKPVTRFEILLGKWLGVNGLNVVTVVICGAAIYAFAYSIQSQREQFSRDRLKVRDVVWTARAAATPTVPAEEINQQVKEYVEQQVEQGQIAPERIAAVTEERAQELLNLWRSVPLGYRVLYEFDNLKPPERADAAIQIRFQARGTPLTPDELVPIRWLFLDPQTGALLPGEVITRERSGNVHQFLVRGASVIRDGKALLCVDNSGPWARTGIFFDGDDSLQLLYKVSSFETNFAKALLIIVLRLALLSAVGVFMSVFVSFPVACLCTFVFYLLAMAQPFVLESIGANMQMVTPEYDPYGVLGPHIRALLVPMLKLVFPDFSHYSGITSLVDGRYIPPGLLGWSFARTLVYGSVLLLLPGWLIFSRREVAEVTV